MSDSNHSQAATMTPEQLIERVCNGFSQKIRDQIPHDAVERAVSAIELADPPPRRSLRLHVKSLRFVGNKRLDGHPDPIPIDYKQKFDGGVNVLLIEDNDVGKSSVLKTIKFALTGDDGDFDADVRSWISDVWLGFCMDEVRHTVVIARREGGLRAVLTVGEEDRPYEAAADNPSRIFSASTTAEVRESFQRFFFDRIGLSRLSWALPGRHDEGEARDAGTSWLTYFQALVIPDGGDRYLLCDPAHAMGNQQGLILSAFLGLRLVEQLNRLGTESAKIKKREEQVAGNWKSVEEEIKTLDAELKGVREDIRRIDTEQQGRRELYEPGHFQERFAKVQDAIVERLAEEGRLRKDREGLTDRIAFTRASEARIREYIALKLHFTGLEVRLCPNCDTEVSDEAIAKEHEAHECRLCHKAAHAVTEGELDGRRAEADALAHQTVDDESRRRRVNARLEQIGNEVVRLRQEGKDLEEAMKTDIARVLPTVVEQSERDRLLQEAGRLAGEMSAKKAELDTYAAQGDDGEIQVRILKKVREVLQQEAESRNEAVLTRLNELTQEVSSLIGAESISDVACSALGQVKLRKHGNAVSFTGIQNQGERMRVKLAFFLAMIRLGREPGLGRHPGLLLIDQPGSGEMVTEDFRALAQVLHRFDEELAHEVQVVCFTARPEFAAATRADKVYGPQAGRYAF